MNFRIKINAPLIPILLMGMTFMIAVNAGSAYTITVVQRMPRTG